MNEFNKLDKKRKILLIVSIITLIILGIVSATVAYFAWVGEESSISVTVVGEGSCSVKEDNDIFIEPTETRDGGRIIKFTAEQGLAPEAYISWNMTVNEIGGLQDATFKYEMINSTTGASYGSGNFAYITDDTTITFINEEETLALNTKYEFILYLWIDGTIGNNPVSMADQTFDFDMNCIISDIYDTLPNNTTLIKHISDLYTDAEKTEVTNNSIDYKYAPSVSLMNDRLGDSKVDAYRGNIRYYGANPNNYIYFNCSDYSNQSDSTCEIWRIIGIVDGKVKIIRSESIGEYEWNGPMRNNWSTSTLNAYLNGDYYNSLKTKNSKTIGLISKSTYYLGSEGTHVVYSDEMYNNERTNEVGTTIYSSNPFTVETNIGMMYQSDYGYATDFNECDSKLLNYDNEGCYSNDWLYISDSEWLINPGCNNYDYAHFISRSGGTSGTNVQNHLEVRPVLYLDTKLGIESGHEGTSTDPYRISAS